MRGAKVDWQLEVYGNAVHGFANPRAGHLNPAVQYHEPRIAGLGPRCGGCSPRRSTSRRWRARDASQVRAEAPSRALILVPYPAPHPGATSRAVAPREPRVYCRAMSRLALLPVLVVLVAACSSKSTESRKRAGEAEHAAAGSAPTGAVDGSAAGASDKPAVALPGVDVAKLDRACAAATDCVLVKPVMCDPCGCTNAAIASKAMVVFDEQANQLACPAPDLDVKCKPCPTWVAACEAGACVAKPQ